MVDINYSQEKNRFNFRVAVFLHTNSKILLVKSDNCDWYNMPGGRVKLGESTKEAIVREMLEELNVKINDVSLLQIAENFFTYDGKNVQELVFIYDCKIKETDPLCQCQIINNHDSKDEKFYWIDFDNLKNYHCLPDLIYSLPNLDTKKITHTIQKAL